MPDLVAILATAEILHAWVCSDASRQGGSNTPPALITTCEGTTDHDCNQTSNRRHRRHPAMFDAQRHSGCMAQLQHVLLRQHLHHQLLLTARGGVTSAASPHHARHRRRRARAKDFAHGYSNRAGASQHRQDAPGHPAGKPQDRVADGGVTRCRSHRRSRRSGPHPPPDWTTLARHRLASRSSIAFAITCSGIAAGSAHSTTLLGLEERKTGFR